MSRFYKIVVSPNPSPPPGFGKGVSETITWTNKSENGGAVLGAQTVEFDICLQTFDSSIGNGFVRIWGPSKEQVSQALDFNGSKIEVYAGMQQGLPLASYASDNNQAGLIISGFIFQAYGNWQGVNQTLDFTICWDGGSTQSNPANLTFQWKKGERLSIAIRGVLNTAYPQYKNDINISDQLVLGQDEHGVFQTLQQFSDYVKRVSIDILGQNNSTYSGVLIKLVKDTFVVRDNTSSHVGNVKEITIQDLIGQPTWLTAYTVSFSTVLRADIELVNRVTFPQLAAAVAVTTPNSGSNVRNKNAFTGDWTITFVRHIGNSRSPDATSWITNFQAVSNQAPSALTSAGNTSA